MLTEKEIITLLKNNEKGFMFLPEEVQEWMNAHILYFNKVCTNGALIAKEYCPFNNGMIYQLRKDYPETTPLPELEEGLYWLSKKDGSVWMFGEYTEIFGIEDGRYGFRQARDSKSFTIDPAKWDIKKIVTENVK